VRACEGVCDAKAARCEVVVAAAYSSFDVAVRALSEESIVSSYLILSRLEFSLDDAIGCDDAHDRAPTGEAVAVDTGE
jgi:hypothetical protein